LAAWNEIAGRLLACSRPIFPLSLDRCSAMLTKIWFLTTKLLTFKWLIFCSLARY
jgi:hypothetical protein